MNRRTFFRSLGGAIAATMIPFGVKVQLSPPKVKGERILSYGVTECSLTRACITPLTPNDFEFFFPKPFSELKHLQGHYVQTDRSR